MSETTKTGEVVTEAPAALELRNTSTADLRSQLSEAIGMTEAAIVHVATIWAELTRRGEDLSNVRFSLARFMLPVARGELLPGLVVAMSGQTRALERVAELSITDQQHLVDGGALSIYRGADRIEHAALADLTYGQIALAIRDGHIRSTAEQKLAYDRSQKQRRKSSARGRPVKITVTEFGIIRVGKNEIAADRMIAELRAAGLI